MLAGVCSRYQKVSRVHLVKAGQNFNAGALIADAVQGAFSRAAAVEVHPAGTLEP